MSEEIVKYDSEHPLSIINIDKEILNNLQTFQKNFLHKEPSSKETKKNAQANDSEYLPISFLEMTLDEIFFGLWQTKNFKTEGIANEIVGSIELHYFHPVAKTWLCRVGAGAVQVQMKSKDKGGDGDITNIRNKITNTLTKDYPHLKADCFRNACLSIGKSFGRDLNRKFDDQYNPIIAKPQQPDVTSLKKQYIDLIELRGYENDSKLTPELLTALIGKLQ
jgi:hypothetical protein